MSQNYSPTLGPWSYLNDVLDTYPGAGSNSELAGQYPGMLGQEIVLSQAEALALTNTSATGYSASTPLYAGRYKYVRMVTSAPSIAPARGLAVYWKAGTDPNLFVVTTDAPTGGTQFAGILINALTTGLYGWILIEGLGYTKGKASSLTNTGAVGQRLSIVPAAGTFDNPDNGALTDSTTGTPTTATLAAGVGVFDLILPVPANMSTLSTGGVDVATGIVLGFKFKILSWEFITTLAGTGSGASLVFNLEIGTTDVGTVVSTATVTLAATSAIGARIAATAVSGANTGSASDTLSLEVAGGGTAFTAGSGYFVIKVQNMDTADAFAGIAAILNSRRLTTDVIAYEAPAAGSLKLTYIGPLVQNPKPGLQ